MRGDRDSEGPALGDGARRALSGSAGDDPLAQAGVAVCRSVVRDQDVDRAASRVRVTPSLVERTRGWWATDRVGRLEATPASLARELGVTWSSVWAAVCRHGQRRVDAVKGVEVTQVGFDETVMSPAKRRRRRRFITTAVDVTNGRIIDVFEGRNAADLRAWLDDQPDWWVSAIKVISVDPHEGYRSAVTRNYLLKTVTIVVDPFHIVRLAGQAVTKCRQRVQLATLDRRGWKGDPLYGIRKLLLMGAEHLDEHGWDRLRAALRDGDPDGVVRDAWAGYRIGVRA